MPRSVTERAGPSPAEIKAVRKEADLTQAEAAELIEVPFRTYQGWEYGESPMPPGLFRLLKILIKYGRDFE